MGSTRVACLTNHGFAEAAALEPQVRIAIANRQFSEKPIADTHPRLPIADFHLPSLRSGLQFQVRLGVGFLVPHLHPCGLVFGEAS